MDSYSQNVNFNSQNIKSQNVNFPNVNSQNVNFINTYIATNIGTCIANTIALTIVTKVQLHAPVAYTFSFTVEEWLQSLAVGESSHWQPALLKTSVSYTIRAQEVC